MKITNIVAEEGSWLGFLYNNADQDLISFFSEYFSASNSEESEYTTVSYNGPLNDDYISYLKRKFPNGLDLKAFIYTKEYSAIMQEYIDNKKVDTNNSESDAIFKVTTAKKIEAKIVRKLFNIDTLNYHVQWYDSMSNNEYGEVDIYVKGKVIHVKQDKIK